ncbi:MAG: flagellar protein FliT [Betaproteobacteria bacterium]|nr:flagellar protein FliT [Betaproteobacteria bacterium]
MSENLKYYESVALASAAMLEAARRSDWDAMVAAEKRCAEIISRLRAAGGEASLGAQGRQRKAEIIRCVLANDAEIRRLVDPRMRELEGVLSAHVAQRRVDHAYRP